MNNKQYYSEGVAIDLGTGVIQSDDQRARLTPVNAKVLTVLLQRPAEVISRSELFDKVWGKQIVSDDALTRAISDLRSHFKSVGANTGFIETVPKRGYRWSAELLPVNNTTQKQSPQEKPTLDQKYQKAPFQEIPDGNKPALTNETQNDAASRQSIKNADNWLLKVKPIVFYLLAFVFIAAVFIWAIQQLLRPEMVRAVILPLTVQTEIQQQYAIDIESYLEKELSAVEKIKLVAANPDLNNLGNHYRYLFREYGAQWVVEGKVRQYGESHRFTLRLIEANTAIIAHSAGWSNSSNAQDQTRIIQDFIKKSKAVMLHDQ